MLKCSVLVIFFELLDNKRNVIFITFAPRIRLKQVDKQ